MKTRLVRIALGYIARFIARQIGDIDGLEVDNYLNVFEQLYKEGASLSDAELQAWDMLTSRIEETDFWMDLPTEAQDALVAVSNLATLYFRYFA